MHHQSTIKIRFCSVPNLLLVALCLLQIAAFSIPVAADTSLQLLPFSQDWTNAGLITTDDDWSSVPGIVGYRGDNLTGSTGTDPQTVLADGASTPVDVNANETNPNGFTTGGVTEFAITNPVVSLAGSGTADAPHLVLHLNATGVSGIWVSFLARDIEDGGNDAIQQIALQYRVGASGDYINVPDGYLPDATIVSATQETEVCVQLPAGADNASDLRVRIITTNAAGSDEAVGIDDILVSDDSCDEPIGIDDVSAAEGNSGTTSFDFTVTLDAPAPMGGVTFDIATADGTAMVANSDYVMQSLVSQIITEGNTTFPFSVDVNGDVDPESNENFFVNITNVVGVTVTSTVIGSGTILNDDAPTLKINQVQGSGSTSPFAGQIVEVKNAVVTVVGPSGFFMQSQAFDYDADPDTSEGIYVFTGAAPTVQAGDQVDVLGDVEEFFDFTEFTNAPTVTIVPGRGTPLPSPVIFDATTPSPNPSAPSCTIEYECYEGMLISVPNGFVNSGNQDFGGDPFAEVFMTAAGQRVFREKGLEFPLGGGGIPTWDGNPELFELDADKLGLAFGAIAGGSTFSATGALGFDFGDYELWPSSLSITPAPLPDPVSIDDPGAPVLTIASFNLFRLFDDIDDPSDMNGQGEVRNDEVRTTQEWNTHRVKIARYILEVMGAPHVVAVQEVESLTVLTALAAEITARDAAVNYTAHLIEGNDIGTIDVGYLTRSPVAVNAVTQLAKDETFVFDVNPPDLTHDRPPLLLEATFTPPGPVPGLDFAVIVLHNRSLGGITTGRVQAKRNEQSVSIAQIVQDYQTTNLDTSLVVLGDMNAFEFTDGYVDVVGQIAGDFDPAENAVSGADLVDPNLVVVTTTLPQSERFSFNFRGNSQALDHALLSEVAWRHFVNLDYGRGNSDAADILFDDDTTVLRASDHDPFVLGLTALEIRIFEDGFESGNTSAWN